MPDCKREPVGGVNRYIGHMDNSFRSIAIEVQSVDGDVDYVIVQV